MVAYARIFVRLLQMSAASLLQQAGAAGGSQRFLHALELLMQVHLEELKVASKSDAGGEGLAEVSVPVAAKAAAHHDAFVSQELTVASEYDTGEVVVAGMSMTDSPKRPVEDQDVQPVDLDLDDEAAKSHRLSFSTQRSMLPPGGRRSSESRSSRSSGDGSGAIVPEAPRAMFQQAQQGVQFLLKGDAEIDMETYDVRRYYHSQGAAQAMAKSNVFSNFTLLVISINAVYLGVDSDYNEAASLNEADLHFVVFEQFFCVFFTAELLVRFCAFKEKLSCLNDGWFKFDSLLLLIIWIETWIVPLIMVLSSGASFSFASGPLRLLRLLRLARLMRIIRAFPELITMIQGMMMAMRAVASAMLLLVVAIYAWGITMHSFLKNDENAVYLYWGTVPRCMMTLMGNGALGDSIGTVMRGIQTNVPALIAFISFVIFSALTILNMLVGVMCEVVAEVAKSEKEAHAVWQLKSTLLVMLKRIDADGNGNISKMELVALLEDECALEVMEDLKINAGHFIDMLDMYYHACESLTIPCIMQLLLDNQGWRPTTVQDLCQAGAFHRWSMRNDLGALHLALVAMRTDLANIQKAMPKVRHVYGLELAI